MQVKNYAGMAQTLIRDGYLDVPEKKLSHEGYYQQGVDSMSSNRKDLEERLEKGTITELGQVALAIENLSRQLWIVAFGGSTYPGVGEKMAVKLEKGAEALHSIASAIEEQD